MLSTMDLKRVKINEGNNEDGKTNIKDKDRINNLPDNLIHYILSFLDTKNAVNTSLLSKRWRYVWTSLPNLELIDDKLIHKDGKFYNEVIERDFAKFVERILCLHDGPYINKFYLKTIKRYDASKVNDWISSVIMRNVREMVLDISNDILDGGLFFPRSFFSSKTLTVLKISAEAVLRIPTSVYFSGLKILYLGFVYVSPYEQCQGISFSCPVLEELFLEECEWVEIKNVNISASALQRLRIKDYPHCHDDGLYRCQINILTESLVSSFELKSNLVYEYCLPDTPSLLDANVDIFPKPRNVGDINGHMTRVLTGISHVKDLTFSSRTIEALWRGSLLSHVATFSNLICLRVIVEYEKDIGRATSFDIRPLVALLRHLPNIDSFHFSNHNKGTEQSWTPPTIPECSLSCLKSVELKNFSGSNIELYLVKFLLKNSTILEKMTIDFGRSLSTDPVKKMETTILLQLFSTGSPGIIRYIKTDGKEDPVSFMTDDC